MTNQTRGESGNGGESCKCPHCGRSLGDPLHELRPYGCVFDTRAARKRERHVLAQRLEAVGHGVCAYDLEAADDRLVVEVANEIANHLDSYCGAPREQDQPIAEDLRDWANRYEAEIAS